MRVLVVIACNLILKNSFFYRFTNIWHLDRNQPKSDVTKIDVGSLPQKFPTDHLQIIAECVKLMSEKLCHNWWRRVRGTFCPPSSSQWRGTVSRTEKVKTKAARNGRKI